MGTYYSRNFSIPAPDADDLINNAPNQFKNLVDKVDDALSALVASYGLNKIRAGSAVIGDRGWGQYIVTLPPGTFTQPPTVVVSNGHYLANPGLVEITDPALVTTAQFQVTCLSSGTGPAPDPTHRLRCNWIAVGN